MLLQVFVRKDVIQMKPRALNNHHRHLHPLHPLPLHPLNHLHTVFPSEKRQWGDRQAVVRRQTAQ